MTTSAEAEDAAAECQQEDDEEAEATTTTATASDKEVAAAAASRLPTSIMAGPTTLSSPASRKNREQHKLDLLEKAFQQAFVETDYEIALAVRGKLHPDANTPYHPLIESTTATGTAGLPASKQQQPPQQQQSGAAAPATSDQNAGLDDGGDPGTTACVVLITPTAIVCANAGDSRALFARRNPTTNNTTTTNNNTHTPAEEGNKATRQDPQDEDECVLCCYPLPLLNKETVYKECCGKMICYGCIIAQRRTLIIGTNVTKPIKGSKEEELEFMRILCSEGECLLCPFCRVDVAENEQEHLKRLWERIDEYNDPNAMRMMGRFYMEGERGLSKNLKKAKELFQRSYALGNPNAAFNLFLLHRNHVPDEARMIQYAEEGARRGNLQCMNFLAKPAFLSGNLEESARHLTMAACSGNDNAMEMLMHLYRKKLLSKEDLATTLRAHKAAIDNLKSEAREYANRYHNFREKKMINLEAM